MNIKIIITAFLVLFAANTLLSQNIDCDKYIMTPENADGKNVKEIKDIIEVSNDDGVTGLSFYLLKQYESNILSLTIEVLEKNTCVAQGDKIKIVFSDGANLELQNEREANCRGKAVVHFGWKYGRKEELNMLQTKKIKSVKYISSIKTINSNFSSEQAYYLSQAIICLSENSK